MNTKATNPASSPEYLDGEYPTDAALQRIREWPVKKHVSEYNDLLAFVRTLWQFGDWGWDHEDVPSGPESSYAAPCRRYLISTGGWSGNESLIDALQANFLFWGMCWVQSRRGGHYIFEVPTDD